MDESADITEILVKWSEGDDGALEKLAPLVQEELRRLAQRILRHERANHTLQPTALVNEVYMRLVNPKKVNWRSRAQFYGLVSTLMRHILVDYARMRQAVKRGGRELTRVALEGLHEVVEPEYDFLALNEALETLASFDPQKARIVELHFFGDLTFAETAEVMKIGHATVERDWILARAWLRRELQ